MDIEGIQVDAINNRVFSKALFSTKVAWYKTFKKKFEKDIRRSHSKIQTIPTKELLKIIIQRDMC